MRRLFVLLATGLFVGCSAHVRPVATPPLAALPVHQFTEFSASRATMSADPTSTLIARAESEFSVGESELALGHRVAARQHFDAALDTLLTVPGGARTEPRLEAAFDSLLDRISAHETLELRAGDVFSEPKSEPAAFDNLLAAGEHPLAPAMSTAQLVAADLANTPHDLPIRVNDKVLSYIELFQTDLRSFVEDGLTRGSRYLPMIQEVLQAQGLPLDLAYVPLIESAFKPTALSRAKARGMWQFEAETAKEVGLQQDWFLDERADPVKATRAAALYLRDLRDAFSGDWALALAAYNAGLGRVQKAMKAANKKDYWDLTSTAKYLPRETREYVPMILAAVLIASNPAQYGFEIQPGDPLAFESVTIPDAIRLGTVAEWINVPVEQIQALNPELRRGMTPTGKHNLKVPVGTGSTVAKHLAASGPSVFASANFRFYTTKRGDTLAVIARRYKTTAVKLAAANDLRATSKLTSGTTLMVPVSPAPALSTRTSASKPASASASAGSSGANRYRVRSGDTLTRISHQFGVSVDRLKELNKISGDALSVGETLTIRR
jgi:membrane-bound lytic murein transglycosylase D